MAGPGGAPSSLHLGMGWFPDQPGGLNRYLRELLGAFAAAGVQSSAVVVGPAGDAPPNVAVAGDARSSLPTRLRRYASAAGGRAEGHDLVDVHFGLYGALPLRMRSLRRLPCVLHFHGPWGAEGAAGGDGAVRARAKRLVERLAYRRADEAVVLSRAFGRLLVTRYGVSPWKVNVIPPGVDLDRFSPGDRDAARAELGLPTEAWIALSVRRLVPRMGLEVLVDAWESLALENGLLVIGGDGPLRVELETRSSSSVRVVGRIDDERLPTYYRAADVCVIPSLSLEGFGLVALEALACGTPAIATDAGGLPEALWGLGDDLIVPAGDAAALAERLAGASAGTRPLPDRAKARAHAERFPWSRAVEQHVELYRRVTQKPKRASLRVVYLDHTAVLSGGELALLHLLPALEDVQAHVILGESGPLVRRLEQAGISVEVLPLHDSTRRRDRHDVGRLSVLGADSVASGLHSLRLARRMRQLKPDLVHTNSLKAALYGGAAARLARVPVVWHVRDRIADDYLGSRGTALVRAAARRLPSAVIANSDTTLASLGVARIGDPEPDPADAAAAREERRAVHRGHDRADRALEGPARLHRGIRKGVPRWARTGNRRRSAALRRRRPRLRA